MRTGSALLHCWSAALEEYDFSVKHRPGKSQTHVDGLSRLPVDPPPSEDALLQVRLVEDEEEARKLARELHAPPTSVDKHCGSSSATSITTKPATASASKPLRVVPNVNWSATMDIARRRLVLSSLKVPGIRCLLTLWDLCRRITSRNSSSCSWIATPSTLSSSHPAIKP